MVNAYSDAFLETKGNTPVMLKKLYYNFPGIDLPNKRTLALLRIAIIGVYEDQIKKAEKEKKADAVMRYNADIKALFSDLKTEFQPKDLTNFVLIRVADYLREKTSAPKQALPYYEELLTRSDKTGLEFKAMLGVADVKGRSDSKADNKDAVRMLDEVVKRAKDDVGTQANAMFRMVEISDKIEDWQSVEKHARAYLDAKHRKKAALVSYLFAKSFDKRNKSNDALVFYSMVYARYMGYIRISAPATKRVMEILWDRNLNEGAVVGEKTLTMSDRQQAYQKIGYAFIASTKKIRENSKEITEAEKNALDDVNALVIKYERSGQVKTMEQVKEEREENRRRGRRND